jgi:hypothetical protein
MLRKLLVGSAHYILGPFGGDSDLRRHGEKIAQRGGKNAKKRAVSGGGGQKTLCAASSSLGLRGGLRTATQCPASGGSRRGGSLRDRKEESEEVR